MAGIYNDCSPCKIIVIIITHSDQMQRAIRRQDKSSLKLAANSWIGIVTE